MNNSVLQVFSIYQNIKKLVKSKHLVTYYDVYRTVSRVWFSRSPEPIKIMSQKIYNDIECHFYTLEDFALTCLLEFLYNNKCDLKMLNHENINNTRELFSKERFVLDKQLLMEMNAQTQLNGLADYFRINRLGNSIVYELIMHEKRFLSPYFFLRFEVKATDEMSADEKMNEPSEEYRRFSRVINIIKASLTTYKIN